MFSCFPSSQLGDENNIGEDITMTIGQMIYLSFFSDINITYALRGAHCNKSALHFDFDYSVKAITVEVADFFCLLSHSS